MLTQEDIFIGEVMAEECYLFEALVWIAFKALPNINLIPALDYKSKDLCDIQNTHHLEIYIEDSSLTQIENENIYKKLKIPKWFYDYELWEELTHAYFTKETDEERNLQAKKDEERQNERKEILCRLKKELKKYEKVLIQALKNGKLKAKGWLFARQKDKKNWFKITADNYDSYYKDKRIIKDDDDDGEHKDIPTEFWKNADVDFLGCLANNNKGDFWIHIIVNLDTLIYDLFPSSNEDNLAFGRATSKMINSNYKSSSGKKGGKKSTKSNAIQSVVNSLVEDNPNYGPSKIWGIFPSEKFADKNGADIYMADNQIIERLPNGNERSLKRTSFYRYYQRAKLKKCS